MNPVAAGKNLSLQFVTEFDSSAKAYGDKSRLRQVVTNLIDNAIKYTQPGGAIVCRIRPVRNQCEIVVEDTGCGIPAEHLSRVFERFYRVDRDRSREVGGTGLGLAIAKHIVEAHGGTLVVKSEVGKGSTFSFNVKR
jgi:two-component system phosphate regulon sensor histidine kinase PhoR